MLSGAALNAASTSNSLREFGDQGNWGTVAYTAGGAVIGGGSAYFGTKGGKTKIYRSVSDGEAKSIKTHNKFTLQEGGMESKQLEFPLSETQEFGNRMGQNAIVSAKIPTNMLDLFYTGGVDTSIFRSGTLTVYSNQFDIFNQAVSAIK